MMLTLGPEEFPVCAGAARLPLEFGGASMPLVSCSISKYDRQRTGTESGQGHSHACTHARTHARTPMTARQHFPLHCPPPMKRCRTTKQFSTGPAEQKTLLKTEAWARMRRVNLSHLIPVVQAVVAPSLSRRYPFCWKEREIVIHRKADFKIATTSSSCCRHNRSDK